MTELTQQFAHPTEIGDTLQSVTASAVDLIDGVDCADVLLISGGHPFRSVAATSRLAIEMDDLQWRFRQGPCLDAAVGNPTVLCNDLREDLRWPRFAEAAVAAGIHCLLSFQLFTHNGRMGALNLFGLKPGAFTVEREAVGAMLATHAAIALIADDARLQFQSALASRDIIGQAQGDDHGTIRRRRGPRLRTTDETFAELQYTTRRNCGGDRFARVRTQILT